MKDGDNLNKVTALHHVQQAIEAIEDTFIKSHETQEMIRHLKEVRKELAYELFRTWPE